MGRPRKEASAASQPPDALQSPPPPPPSSATLFGGGALLLLPALVAAALAGIGLIVWQMTVHHNHLYDITWVVAGGVMMLTVPLTAWQVRRQLLRAVEPQLQLLAVRLAWLPLVQAIDAWFALKMRAVQVFSALFCGWYQAWAVYSLYAYLAACIAIGAAEAKGEAEAVPSARAMALCRAGALQYSAVRFCVSCAAFATTFARKYGDGSISASFAYFPLTIAVNVSQAVALAALAALASRCGALPQPRPRRCAAKAAWLCAVVFGAYWQEMLIYALLRFGAVATSASWTVQSTSRADVALGMHAWILCADMAAAAAAFGAAFPPEAAEAEGGVAQGVGFVAGLACALGVAAPPLAPPPPDAEAGDAEAEAEAEARAAEAAAAAKEERRRRRARAGRRAALAAAPSGGGSFSDSARLDAPPLDAAPAEEAPPPADEPDAAPPPPPKEPPLLQPPRARRRRPLPYALSAMPVVLAPPEPEDAAASGKPSAAPSGVYSSILGWMGLGEPSHPYSDAPPPVPLPPPGLPLRAVVPPDGGAQTERRPHWAEPPREAAVPPASESLSQLLAKLAAQVQASK